MTNNIKAQSGKRKIINETFCRKEAEVSLEVVKGLPNSMAKNQIEKLAGMVIDLLNLPKLELPESPYSAILTCDEMELAMERQFGEGRVTIAIIGDVINIKWITKDGEICLLDLQHEDKLPMTFKYAVGHMMNKWLISVFDEIKSEK